MAVTRGQKSDLGLNAVSTSQACTWSVNPTAGSSILVFIQSNTASTNMVVKDNGTSITTFTLDASQVTGGKHAFIYRANNISLPGSGSYTVNLTNAVDPANTLAICGIEYLGMASGAPAATNTATATSTSVTTNAASSTGVQFGGFSNATGTVTTITYTGPGTQQFVNTDGATYWPVAVADNISNGSTTHTWTTGASASYGACIAAYDAAAGAAIAPNKQYLNTYAAITRASSY
jgi:hypothetical protein